MKRIDKVMGNEEVIVSCDGLEHNRRQVIRNFCPQDFQLDGDGEDCAVSFDICKICWEREVD